MRSKIYFASDFHLGTPNYAKSLAREKKVVAWLESIKNDAKEIYLLGDIFDFWFEYKTVVPKGFTRLLGKIAELSDAGIPIKFFTGNHDLWMKDYFEKELNVEVYHHPITAEWNGKKFFIGHGDGLGPKDYGYKFINKIFKNKFCQWLFAQLHPGIGIKIAQLWSKKSRNSNSSDKKFLGEEKEHLLIYAKDALRKEHFDFFIFGHRHIPLDITLSNNVNGKENKSHASSNSQSRYINLGDWITHYSYAEFDGTELKLKYFNQQEQQQE
ncbi:MAG: UDP-2,3-diacylglucosamine diphosphatase [Bacteroidetes bacterium]|nr:UDP-2,3-diacylglucosamine diphosphatase [Bacteroidota bacterium]